MAMKDTIINTIIDSQQVLDSANNIAEAHNTCSIRWVGGFVVAFILAAFFLLRKRKNTIEDETLRSIKRKTLNEKSEIDFGNIINSAFHAEELYKVLIRKCHPDRFPGDETLIKIATELSAEITKNKNNLQELKKLQKIAEEKLNITI